MLTHMRMRRAGSGGLLLQSLPPTTDGLVVLGHALCWCLAALSWRWSGRTNGVGRRRSASQKWCSAARWSGRRRPAWLKPCVERLNRHASYGRGRDAAHLLLEPAHHPMAVGRTAAASTRGVATGVARARADAANLSTLAFVVDATGGKLRRAHGAPSRARRGRRLRRAAVGEELVRSTRLRGRTKLLPELVLCSVRRT